MRNLLVRQVSQVHHDSTPGLLKRSHLICADESISALILPHEIKPSDPAHGEPKRKTNHEGQEPGLVRGGFFLEEELGADDVAAAVRYERLFRG